MKPVWNPLSPHEWLVREAEASICREFYRRRGAASLDSEGNE